MTLRVEYGYSETSDMISDTDFLPDGKMNEKNEYEYDNQGRVTGGKSYDAENKVTGSFVFSHSDDHKKIEFQKYTPSDSLDYKLIYTYETNFDLQDYSTAEKTDPAGNLQMKVIKQFYPDGKVSKKAIFNEKSELTVFFKYFYDEKGNTTRIEKYKADGSLEWTDRLSYDDKGICTGLESYDDQNKLTTIIKYTSEKYQ